MMTKEIRVLTGVHRGAALRLSPGRWQIGADPTADIQLSDWRQAPLLLLIGQDGGTRTQADDADAAERPLADMRAVRFGDIVLCLGDADAPWPDDAALLEQLEPVATTVAAVPVPARGRPAAHWLMALGAVLGLATGGVAIYSQPSRADDLPRHDQLLRQVRQQLLQLRQPDLEALVQGDLIVVRGLVGNSAQAAAVRQMLQSLAPTQSLADIATVSDVIANIQDTLRDHGLRVGYEGQGRFVVDGSSARAAELNQTVTQLAADFGPDVKQIRGRITPLRRDWAAGNNDSALATDALQYVQAQDGSKHFPGVRE
ncbi:hypothetical protein D0T25_24190 [Duganella sp. BJB488]|uniref:hypothetical protein n=1 Tax=unclassified Duganella TaxID=2636909 RepID=UPI000E357D4B|nr:MULTISPECIES: hypothetical protein [unclassified Duganella]RFP09354.1 hypothetical protein D0T23_26995 [Duganella sp. BJB475]RFP13242.1 hypothetical protein D0T26_23430 [Duganella sp. BJB489]RFP17183.1 hypothetical protein D0T25_24190 [Duganella sp. BJB488]RFP25390.1 hypothetical protein D0T21_28025 [Duganella sp. BJB476]RFP31597.1 hypothetical protein D0T24_24525 [Duganella sp. BJB480]